MPRLQQDKFTVFVSHKSADKELASLVADELVNLAPDQVVCWVSGEALTAGIDWNREIKQQLAQSHLLVLLFTTPQHNWDWCLYEVGLFVRFEADEVLSVACLFDPDGSPPAPLNQVQCVRATSEEIAKQLVRPLCTHTWNLSDTWQRGALVPGVSDDIVDAAARRIADGFHGTLANSGSGPSADLDRYQPCHRIVLDIEHCAQVDTQRGIPRDARVVEGPENTTSYTLSLFRAHVGTAAWTWGDLVDEVEGRDAPWLRDLDERFVHSLRRRLWSPSMELIEVWRPDSNGRRTYRPIIYEVVRRVSDHKPIETTILLIPDDDPRPADDGSLRCVADVTLQRIRQRRTDLVAGSVVRPVAFWYCAERSARRCSRNSVVDHGLTFGIAHLHEYRRPLEAVPVGGSGLRSRAKSSKDSPSAATPTSPVTSVFGRRVPSRGRTQVSIMRFISSARASRFPPGPLGSSPSSIS